MELLDLVKGFAQRFLGGGKGTENPLLDIALNLLTNPQTGGLNGMVETFKNKGLGDIMSSWVSTGQNLPISPGQILQALGGDQVQQFAGQLGASKEDVSRNLASLLPGLIDKLTPNGKLPDQASLEQKLKTLRTDWV